jgi:periplasmic protein CpxP/Spy
MRRQNSGFSALVLVAALAGAALVIVPASGARAQANNSVTQSTPSAGAHKDHRHFEPGRFIEGRIAFLKAVLKITPAQEAQWNKVASAMRLDVQEKQQMFERMRAMHDQPRTAMQSLEMRAQFAQLRARESERFLAAFRPLYASLSADQKKAADELLGHWHGHHHWRG